MMEFVGYCVEEELIGRRHAQPNVVIDESMDGSNLTHDDESNEDHSYISPRLVLPECTHTAQYYNYIYFDVKRII
jgi:hypothetical protein